MTAHDFASKINNPDVVIIGGGPVGSYVALQLAKKGIKTTVFEEHSKIGLPSHCAGHLSIRSLRKLGFYPLPEDILENSFCIANFYSPQGTRFTLKLRCPVTVAVNRTQFDQNLASKAMAAGAFFSLNSSAQSIITDKGYSKGVTVRFSDGLTRQVHSKITIDAEGISSRLLRQMGLPTLKTSSLVYAVEAELENVQNVDLDAVEVYFGKGYAPGFYGWLIPRPDGSAKVGLATNKGDPREYLKRLMSKHPIAQKQLSKSTIKKIGFHAIPLGGQIQQVCANAFLAVGDCASQVKPTTGGGIIFGLTAAKEAAEVASQALEEDDVSLGVLRSYQQRCNALFNFDFRVMLRLRRFLDSLSDEKLDEMLRVCSKLNVEKALHDIDEIDFQGKMLLNALKKPAISAAIIYFGLLYLSANP
jgi:digeranylgeranylglycerophospholipid reductase